MNDSRIYIGAYMFDPGERPFQPLKKQLMETLLDPKLTESALEHLLPQVE
jgi:hypothetical protein